MSRRGFVRFAAPAAFLAAVTIAVLVVRAGLEQGARHPGRTTTTTPAQTTRRHSRKKGHGHRRTYTVRLGDTLSSIAGRTGTTVAQLEHLNPGVSPTALRVGEKIRVG